MAETKVLTVENLSKEYRKGSIGYGTLRRDLQSWWAKIRKKDDPNSPLKNDKSDEGVFLAVDDVSFYLNRGEALGLIGKNGAGKSTLLKLLSRITAPTRGEIKYVGRIASMIEIGAGFHPELTGRENIYLNGAILGMSKAEIDSKVKDIIEFSECADFIDTPTKRYSSGMLIKLAFSVVAYLDAEILLMDEVLAVSDMAFKKKCFEKIRDIIALGERSVICVSHNMDVISSLCSRCLVLESGKIIFDGETEEAIKIYSEL